MTDEEFNEKYREYAEPGFEDQLLMINNPEVAKYLDVIFQELLIDTPDFQFALIKLKFGRARFYTNLPYQVESMVENGINQIVSHT